MSTGMVVPTPPDNKEKRMQCNYKYMEREVSRIAPEIISEYECPNADQMRYDEEALFLASNMASVFKDYLMREGMRSCVEDGRTSVTADDIGKTYKQLIPAK